MSEEREDAARKLGLTRAKGVPYYRRGLQSYEENDLENAILDLSEAIHYDRGYAEYYSTRGLFYVQANQFESAQLDLDYALKLNKRQWLALYGLGIMEFTNEHYDAAADYFSKASAIKPDRPEIWYYYAVAKHEAGDDEQALISMEKAESLFAQGDKRRKEATAWVKELKKSPPSSPTPPPLSSGNRPQLKPPESPSRR